MLSFWDGPWPRHEQVCGRMLSCPTFPAGSYPVRLLHQSFCRGVLLVVPTVTFSQEKNQDSAGDSLLGLAGVSLSLGYSLSYLRKEPFSMLSKGLGNRPGCRL